MMKGESVELTETVIAVRIPFEPGGNVSLFNTAAGFSVMPPLATATLGVSPQPLPGLLHGVP